MTYVTNMYFFSLRYLQIGKETATLQRAGPPKSEHDVAYACPVVIITFLCPGGVAREHPDSIRQGVRTRNRIKSTNELSKAEFFDFPLNHARSLTFLDCLSFFI